MKLGILILMNVSLVIHSLSFAIIYASFKIQQDYIAANLCVKKDEPVNTCQGHCQLKKKIQEHEDQEEESPLIREGVMSLSYLAPDFEFPFKLELSFINHRKIFLEPVFTTTAITEIFHPPKFNPAST
jgi:hypothetical protein